MVLLYSRYLIAWKAIWPLAPQSKRLSNTLRKERRVVPIRISQISTSNIFERPHLQKHGALCRPHSNSRAFSQWRYLRIAAATNGKRQTSPRQFAGAILRSHSRLSRCVRGLKAGSDEATRESEKRLKRRRKPATLQREALS